MFRSFIMSNFNYCPVVWFFCSITNTRKIERIQYRALKFVYNDYSSDYTTLLSRGNHNTILVHRLRYIAIETYKCINKLNPSFLHDVFKAKVLGYNLRDSNLVIQPVVNTVNHGINSFRYHGAKIWNNLPTDIKSAITINDFKSMLKQWDGQLCSCSLCSTVF